MSRTKEATSKKRKLTDAEQIDSAVPPRKSRIILDDELIDTAGENLDAGVLLQNAVVGDGLNADVRLIDEDGKRARRTGRKGKPEVFLEGAQVESSTKDEETGEQKSAQGERTVKAALRQAKSERRSKKKKAGLADAAPATKSPEVTETAFPNIEDQEEHQTQAGEMEQEHSIDLSKPESKQRFIVFIGNLPYTATTLSIRSHFSKLQPFTIRHSTDKATGRSRGFAFLEFEGYDKMKTCLKLYHHSLFEVNGEEAPLGAGKRKKSQARKINVELTAGGGGGKSVARKEKIKGKNEKLEGERERTRVHREKEEAAAYRKKRRNGEKTGADTIEVGNGEDGDENMHPSRRKRMAS